MLLAATGALIAAACGTSVADTPPRTGSAAAPVGRPDSPLAANAALAVWPDQITRASSEIREAYAYAVRRPRSLQNIPCYCGCGASGHRNNQDCYVKTFASDGWVVLDLHGYGWGVCVGITRDVIAMEKQGQPLAEIRRLIDAKWSSAGPGTNTPLP